VKVGKDESGNEILRKWGTPKKFDFQPKDHLELGEILDIVDVQRASKISGPRFYFLKNDGVLLEFALKQLAFEILIKEGFIPILPPALIKTEVMKGLGYMENGGDQDVYVFPGIRETQLNGERRIGLGTMGLGDALIKMSTRIFPDGKQRCPACIQRHLDDFESKGRDCAIAKRTLSCILDMYR